MYVRAELVSSILHSPGFLSQGMVSSTTKMGLPMSINMIKTVPYSCAHRPTLSRQEVSRGLL